MVMMVMVMVMVMHTSVSQYGRIGEAGRQAGAEWRFGWHCRDQISLSVSQTVYILDQGAVQ